VSLSLIPMKKSALPFLQGRRHAVNPDSPILYALHAAYFWHFEQ
jgi:hypothetical protein